MTSLVLNNWAQDSNPGPHDQKSGALTKQPPIHFYQTMCLKSTNWMANSVDPDETADIFSIHSGKKIIN